MPLPTELPKQINAHLPKTPLVDRPRVSATLIRDAENQIILNPVKRYLRPYWLTTEPELITLPALASDPEPSNVIPMTIDNQGPIEIMSSVFVSDGPFTVEFFDAEYRRLLMNREIHINTFAGTAARPFIWPTTWMIYPEKHGKVIFAVFRNLSPNENNIRFALHGRKLWHYESPEEVLRAWGKYSHRNAFTFPYFLTTNRNIRLSGVNATDSAQIRNTDDAEFEVYKQNAAVTDIATGNILTNDSFEATLTESSNQRPSMNQAIRGDLLFGGLAAPAFADGLFSHIVAEPTLYERNHKQIIDVTVLLAQPFDELEINVTFAGRKLMHEPSS